MDLFERLKRIDGAFADTPVALRHCRDGGWSVFKLREYGSWHGETPEEAIEKAERDLFPPPECKMRPRPEDDGWYLLYDRGRLVTTVAYPIRHGKWEGGFVGYNYDAVFGPLPGTARR